MGEGCEPTTDYGLLTAGNRLSPLAFRLSRLPSPVFPLPGSFEIGGKRLAFDVFFHEVVVWCSAFRDWQFDF